MAERISSLDPGYVTGDLSVFPQAIDTKNTLYEARNNAETTLRQSLSYSAKSIIVNDATSFPPSGLIRIGPRQGPGLAELVAYESRTNTIFNGLHRGFAGSRQQEWPAGVFVTNSVMAEHHNAIKDAIIQIQKKLGIKDNPVPTSLNGLLKQLEAIVLSPQPSFRAYPKVGPPPLKVRFQNMSGSHIIKFLWDFGDGITSTERNPTHTYAQEGLYTVKLNTITSTGAQGVAVKSNFINASDEEHVPFFYAEVLEGFSTATAAARTAMGNPTTATTFTFVDQTDGDILQRFWSYDDNTADTVDNPNIHIISHIYASPGSYSPSLIIAFGNQKVKRVTLVDTITVL